MSDFAEELAKLHNLRGTDFSHQTDLIAYESQIRGRASDL